MPLTRRRILLGASVGALLPSVAWPADESEQAFPLALDESEWRDRLTPAEFGILREAGTEPPGTSELLHEKREGTFVCAGCEQSLFSSHTKYDSRTGWPSFWAPLDGAVGTREDRKLLFMTRTEVFCTRCGGHLGHVFEDGPEPTGLRYCINGLALDFVPASGEAAS